MYRNKLQNSANGDRISNGRKLRAQIWHSRPELRKENLEEHSFQVRWWSWGSSELRNQKQRSRFHSLTEWKNLATWWQKCIKVSFPFFFLFLFHFNSSFPSQDTVAWTSQTLRPHATSLQTILFVITLRKVIEIWHIYRGKM